MSQYSARARSDSRLDTIRSSGFRDGEQSRPCVESAVIAQSTRVRCALPQSMIAAAVATSLAMAREIVPYACLAFLAAATANVAMAAEAVSDKLAAPMSFDIPAQPLGMSLKQLADQAGIQIFYEERLVAGLSAPAVKANFSAIQALTLLLSHTELEFAASNETVAVRKKPNVASRADAAQTNRSSAFRLAQAPAPRDDASNQLARPEEIIVTARKREESLIDVPVVSNVLTQDVLERTKTDNLFAVSSRVPALQLGDTVASVGTQVSLRGVGTTTINPTMDQSVSLVIDGLPLSQGVGYSAGMFDVAQIEVLKGPQALFFGKNNTAGVISLRSADPTDAAEVITRGGYEYEADEKVVDFIVSGPVADTLKLRFAGRYSDQTGFFTNDAEAIPGLGGRTPEFRSYAPTTELILRGTALYEPTDALTMRLKLNYNEQKMDGGSSPLQTVYCPEGTGGVPPNNVPFIGGDDCKTDRSLRLAWFDPAAYPGGLPNGAVQFQDRTTLFGTLDVNLDLSESLALTSVTGYFDNDHLSMHQATSTGTTNAGASITPFTNRQFTQELRLTSDFAASPVNFMLGAFYLDGRQHNGTEFRGNTLLGLPRILQHGAYDVDISSTSLFGQLIWNITEQLELGAGARWTDEEREQRQFNFNPAQTPLGEVRRPDPKISSSNVSPEVTLTYKPTDDFTAFASYKTGFKSGSFNTITFTPPDRFNSFDDEEAKGGEVGIKTRMLDGRLTLNVAPYYYEYMDLQVGANEISDLGAGNVVVILRTLNAASATVQGVDFDVSYALAAIDGLTLNAAVNYNEARYDSFANAPCGNGQTIAQGCSRIFNPATQRFSAQDLSGQRLVRAPDWSGYAGADYQMQVGSDLTLVLGGGANFTSAYSTTLVDLPGFEQEDFVKFNANVALRGRDDKWEAALIGQNLGNELTRGWCSNSNNQNGGVFGGQISGAVAGGPAGGDEAACFIERGRQVWARMSWKF
jgi:iron complex outermembrane receptor protein